MSRVSAITAEFVGTAFLLAGVVGSGIMAERLSPDDTGLQLFENAFATAGILVALILAFREVSGAHFNPAVTLTALAFGEISLRRSGAYIAAQVSGAIVGVMCANIMFELDVVNWSEKDRSSGALVFAEVIATLGLIIVIFGVVRSREPSGVAFAVGAYIAAAYFFTASTSFANPAVTIARTFSDTFAGIKPSSAPMFIVAQLIGTIVAIGLIAVMWSNTRGEPED